MFARLVPAVLAGVLVLPAVFASGPAPASGEWTPLVALAPVDIATVASEVERTGEATLLVAGKPLRVALREHDIFAPGGRAIVEVGPGFTQTVIGYVTARTFQGDVVGETVSAAVITLDAPKDALYGTIFADDRAYFLRTVLLEGRTFLETTWEEAAAPVPPGVPLHASTHADEFGTLHAGSRSTFIRPVGSVQYAADPTWTTHVTDVFNQQHAMWDNQINIHQTIGPFTTMANQNTGSCDTLLNAFAGFVQSGINGGWWQDAYQLFAHNSLDCAGLAVAASTYSGVLSHGTSNMVSVLQAHDHGIWDNYDPDLSYHLGLVSGQELSHNYGEFDHGYDCRAWSWGSCVDYNIMAAGKDPDDVGFWWTQTSYDRIQHDSYGQL